MQLIVYTEKTSPRVDYIFSTLLPAIGVHKYSLTNNADEFITFEGAKVNYSSTAIDGSLHIQPVALLFEAAVRQQELDCFEWNGNKAFFKSSGDLPFDIFAASFYLLSRYEEYLPHNLDFYGRYSHENSIAFKEGFLQLPLVNLWLQDLAKRLQEKFPSINLSPSPFRFIPTYDIDIAWSYKHKGLVRNAGGIIKSLLKGEVQSIKERIAVLQGKQQDPFDSYNWLQEEHQKFSAKPLYFFLLAQRNKGYDKNILPTSTALQTLVKEHANRYEVCVHPSWQSGDEASLLGQEINLLAKAVGKPIEKSRQHYIRMSLPTTYRQLIEAGIKEDYSMGYGSINGFRASFCLPYEWYDLAREQQTNLTILPFCYMEANSFYEQHYSTAQATAELEHYYSITKAVDGLLITIWHNHFLGTDRMFVGWKQVYENFLEKFRKE